MKRYAGEFSWVVVAQVASFIGGLATVKVAAFMLGPSEYGKLTTGLAAAGIIQVCLYGSLAQTATRFLMAAAAGKLLPAYQRSLLMLIAVATIIVGAAGALAYAFGAQDWLTLPVVVLCAYVAINGVQIVAIAVCNAARKRKLVALVQTIDALFRPATILATTGLSAATAYLALTGYVLSTCVVVVLILGSWFVFGMSPNSEPSPSVDVAPTNRHLASKMVSFTAPFLVFGILGAIGSHGERLILSRYVTWAEVGSYALMTQLVLAPSALYTAVINQFYYPLVFQYDPDGNRKKIRSFRFYLLISILGVVAITVLAALVGPTIIPMFSSREFLGNEHLLWILGGSVGLFCIGQQLVLPGLQMNKPEVYIPAKFIHSAALLTLSILLLPSYGVLGMSVSSLLSSAMYLGAILLANIWLDRRSRLQISAA